MTRARLVIVTGPDLETLRAITKTLVDERLIACANLLDGVTSVYRWEGAVSEDAECLAFLKTTSDRLESLEIRVSELHPYDVPEFVVVEVDAGSERYLGWVEECTRAG